MPSGSVRRVALDTSILGVTRAGTARYVEGLLSGFRESPPKGAEIKTLDWPVENYGYTQPLRALKTLAREYLWARVVAPIRIRKGAFDVLHSPANWLIEAPKNVRHVVTQHDLSLLRHPERFRSWHRISGTRRMKRLKDAHAIITVSQFTADELISEFALDSRKIFPVHNGCDFGSHSEEKCPSTFEVPEEYFLFVGSLEPGKNLSLLRQVYEAAAKSNKQLPPLVIIGVRWAGVSHEGEWPKSWIYAGRVSDEELIYLYRRAVALVFPSKYEGFGLPPLEAMALGCPVICSPVSSLPEVVGDAALLVPLEIASYQEAMTRCLKEDSLREELIARGKSRAPALTWAECARKTSEVYQQV